MFPDSVSCLTSVTLRMFWCLEYALTTVFCTFEYIAVGVTLGVFLYYFRLWYIATYTRRTRYTGYADADG